MALTAIHRLLSVRMTTTATPLAGDGGGASFGPSSSVVFSSAHSTLDANGILEQLTLVNAFSSTLGAAWHELPYVLRRAFASLLTAADAFRNAEVLTFLRASIVNGFKSLLSVNIGLGNLNTEVTFAAAETTVGDIKQQVAMQSDGDPTSYQFLHENVAGARSSLTAN